MAIRLIQLKNKDAIESGGKQFWNASPIFGSESVAIAAIPATGGPGVHISRSLAVEDVSIETTLDDQSDPVHKVHFTVRNVGSERIQRFTVNVNCLSEWRRWTSNLGARLVEAVTRMEPQLLPQMGNCRSTVYMIFYLPLLF